MTTVLSFFNHKGGVGKTTNAFNIGWKIAESGKKVLLIDLDPQCNLTGLTLGIEDYDGLLSIYNERKSIYDYLKPFVDGAVSEVQPSPDIIKTRHQNLYIIPGHVDVATFDNEIATAITVKDNLKRILPLVGMFNKFIRTTATKHSVDIVIVDMSPSISATNKCLLMGCDYFIVPTAPDFFSHQAIDSLSKILKNWPNELQYFKDDLMLPRKNPKMIGTLLQNYRRYDRDGTKGMAMAFSKWANKIRDITNNKLAKSLSENNINMMVDEDIFKKYITHDSPYNLGEIQNFNTLIPKSQQYSKPIYALTESELALNGEVLQIALENVREANERYRNITDGIMGIIYDKTQ